MSISDEIGFRAAAEAVIGVTLRGEKPTLENVQDWIKTAIDPNVPTRDVTGVADFYVRRMLGGPFPPGKCG